MAPLSRHSSHARESQGRDTEPSALNAAILRSLMSVGSSLERLEFLG
jgi:hypothetical protein